MAFNNESGESALSLIRRISSGVTGSSCSAIEIAGEKLNGGEVVAFGGTAALSVATAVLCAAVSSGRKGLVVDCSHSPALISPLRAVSSKVAENISVINCWDCHELTAVLAGLRSRAARASADVVLIAGLGAFFCPEQHSKSDSNLNKLAESLSTAVTGTPVVGMWTAPAWIPSPRPGSRRADVAVSAGLDKESPGVGVAQISRIGMGICLEKKFTLSSYGTLHWLPNT